MNLDSTYKNILNKDFIYNNYNFAIICGAIIFRNDNSILDQLLVNIDYLKLRYLKLDLKNGYTEIYFLGYLNNIDIQTLKEVILFGIFSGYESFDLTIGITEEFIKFIDIIRNNKDIFNSINNSNDIYINKSILSNLKKKINDNFVENVCLPKDFLLKFNFQNICENVVFLSDFNTIQEGDNILHFDLNSRNYEYFNNYYFSGFIEKYKIKIIIKRKISENTTTNENNFKLDIIFY